MSTTDTHFDGTVATEGTELSSKLTQLTTIVEAASGRVDDALVAKARDLLDRASSRLRLSSQHTVVALAGATGSGKSSTFNALTGLELSAVGVRRPTTSWASACIWGTQGATELLEWLGIPDRHQTTRDSMLDTRKEGQELDGVVLLDLPDHDSTEVAHHLEMERLLPLADALIWVLDPQKYADAAIHDRYLQPMRDHQGVMIVVLNHIDEVPEAERDAMVADLKGILDREGLSEVQVMPIAAKLGWGVPELKAAIQARVADKKATRDRLDADIAKVAHEISTTLGDAQPVSLSADRVEQFDDAVTEATGVTAVSEALKKSSKFRVDLPDGLAVQRGRVGDELRQLADDVSTELPAAWQKSLSKVAVSVQDPMVQRLDAELDTVRTTVSRLGFGVILLRVLPWIFLVVAVAAGVWSLVLHGQGKLGEAMYTQPSWWSGTLEHGYPVWLTGAALAVAIILFIVSLISLAVAKRNRAAKTEAKLRNAVSTITLETVVTPIENELIAFRRLREALTRLRA